jgi:acyl carrier protein
MVEVKPMSEVFKQIRSMLADLASCPEDDIKLQTKLFKDLDIESVEVLELEYMIDDEFEIELGDKDLWKLPVYLVNHQMIQGGKITDEGIKLVKENLSIKDKITDIASISGPNDIYAVIEVSDIVSFVEAKQEACV